MKLTMKQVVVLVAVFFLGYFVRSGCAGLIEGQENQQMLKCGGLSENILPNDNENNGGDCPGVTQDKECVDVTDCSTSEQKINMAHYLYVKLGDKSPFTDHNPSDSQLDSFKNIFKGQSLCNTKCPS